MPGISPFERRRLAAALPVNDITGYSNLSPMKEDRDRITAAASLHYGQPLSRINALAALALDSGVVSSRVRRQSSVEEV